MRKNWSELHFWKEVIDQFLIYWCIICKIILFFRHTIFLGRVILRKCNKMTINIFPSLLPSFLSTYLSPTNLPAFPWNVFLFPLSLFVHHLLYSSSWPFLACVLFANLIYILVRYLVQISHNIVPHHTHLTGHC